MSFFRRVSEGSLLSDERLMHARDGYLPKRVTSTSEMALPGWAERAVVQSDIVISREMAGLTDEQLGALFAEFVQAPRLRRLDKARYALPVGAIGVALGFLGLAVAEVAKQAGQALPLLQGLSLAPLLIGLICVCTGSLMALARAPTEMAYGKIGLFVGVLDEQHPWLYKTAQLLHHEAARKYQSRVLAERGLLRGVDYVLMREVAAAHESLELTETARTVTRKLQCVAPAAAVPDLSTSA